MALKITTLLLVFSLSLLLSYSVEAQPASSPVPTGNEATPAPSAPLEFENRKKFIADKVKEALPKAQEFLQKIKKRMEETPGSSPSEQCLMSCMATYEKVIVDMKTTAENLSLQTALEFDSKMSGLKAELEACEMCNAEVSKEDPEIMKYNQWFNGVTVEILNELNQYNS